MSDATFETMAMRVRVAERAMCAALQPEAVWVCAHCRRPIDRTTFFDYQLLRDQVGHLPYSSSIIGIALMNLLNDGTLVEGNRMMLSVDRDKLNLRVRMLKALDDQPNA
jgi:hypothetical protein